MIILPDRNIPRAKFLMPVPDKIWREPSLFVPKDEMGNDIEKTRFRIDAKTNDGVVIWSGWFDDRADFDAFLYAIALGTLKQERALWDLPTPNWQPYLGELVTYNFATVTALTGNPGSVSSYTVPIDWNSGNNNVACIGGGGSGTNGPSNAGGGGAFASSDNVILIAGSSISYSIGSGSTGGATSAAYYPASPTAKYGAPGGDTYFIDTLTILAKGGKGGSGTGNNAGGQASLCVGSIKYSGGDGFNTNTFYSTASSPSRISQSSGGGGGAAGPNGNGVSATVSGLGGNGDNGLGGAGGTSSPGTATAGGVGGNGTEYSSLYGSGGGGGGGGGSVGGGAGGGGNGGNYGGGGGSGATYFVANTSFQSAYLKGGNGIQGLVVLTYTPAIDNINLLGFGFI